MTPPISLEQFMANLRANAEGFEEAYKAKAAANPDQYPLVLAGENAGLWIEFFLTYLESGEA